MESKILLRHQWFAQPSKPEVTELLTPVQFVLSGFTNRNFTAEMTKMFSPRTGAASDQCVEALLNLQTLHMRRYPDIRYNFMIAPDGKVYKGRGWAIAPNLPKRYVVWRKKCLYIGLIGNFKDQPPSDNMFKLKRELIEFGVKSGYITPRFTDVSRSHKFFKPLINQLLTYI